MKFAEIGSEPFPLDHRERKIFGKPCKIVQLQRIDELNYGWSERTIRTGKKCVLTRARERGSGGRGRGSDASTAEGR